MPVIDLFEWCIGSIVLVPQSCPALCDRVHCSLPGSSVHGIFQARISEWVAISSSRGSSQPRDQTRVSRTAGKLFTIWITRQVPENENYSFKRYPAHPLNCPHRRHSRSCVGLQVSLNAGCGRRYRLCGDMRWGVCPESRRGREHWRLDPRLCVLGCVWLCQAPLSMDSPGKNTGVSCHFLLQGIFLTQGSDWHLLHRRQILYHWHHLGSPRTEVDTQGATVWKLNIVMILVTLG